MNGLQDGPILYALKNWAARHETLIEIVLCLVFAALAVLIVLLLIHSPSAPPETSNPYAP